jgi:hypothetical protein
MRRILLEVRALTEEAIRKIVREELQKFADTVLFFGAGSGIVPP